MNELLMNDECPTDERSMNDSRYSRSSAEHGVKYPPGKADERSSGENGFPIAVAEMENEAGEINADESRNGAGGVHHAEKRTGVLRNQILNGGGGGRG